MKKLAAILCLSVLAACAASTSPFPSCVNGGQVVSCDDGVGGGEAGGAVE